VPIDDTRCYWYSMFVSYTDPVDVETLRAQRIDKVDLPLYRSRTGRANQWGFDPIEQATSTFNGMGSDINVHDQWAVESPGVIVDRTREHLSPADVGIRAQRRLFLEAARAPSVETLIGTANPSALTGPAAVDSAATDDDFDGAWRRFDTARRVASGWAPALNN
jgi:phthalate 4,5-dioxygenase